MLMCCVCSTPRAFVQNPVLLPDRFVNVSTFYDVISEGPFTHGSVQKLIIFDLDTESYGWYSFCRVALTDVLIFCDVPNFFEPIEPNLTSPLLTYAELMHEPSPPFPTLDMPPANLMNEHSPELPTYAELMNVAPAELMNVPPAAPPPSPENITPPASPHRISYTPPRSPSPSAQQGQGTRILYIPTPIRIPIIDMNAGDEENEALVAFYQPPATLF